MISELDKIKEYIAGYADEIQRISKEVEASYYGGSGHALELKEIADDLKQLSKNEVVS